MFNSLHKCFGKDMSKQLVLESTGSSEAIAAEVIKFAVVSFSYFVKEIKLKLLV